MSRALTRDAAATNGKNTLRQAEELKNQKTSLRAGKGKRQVVTYAGVAPLFGERMKSC